ncbi:hypothetical protein EOM81_11615 [bacterium]|nr:hypothetical protein [bacterium]
MQPNAVENKQFQFLGYRISSFSFQVREGFDSSFKEISQEINIQKKISPDSPRTVDLKLFVGITAKDSSLELKIELVGKFQAHPEMSEDLFEKISNQNAPAILYPFARAFIASMTAQANIPPIILPIVNLSKPVD